MSQPVIICQKWLLRHVLHGGLVTLMCGKLVIKTNIQKWSIRWDNIRSFWLLAWRGVWGLWGGPGSCGGHPGCGQCSMSRVTSPSARGGYTSTFLSWKYEIIGNFLSCFRYFTMFSQNHLQTHWLDIFHNNLNTKIIRHFIVEKSFEYPPLAATGHSQDIVGPDSSHSGTSVWEERDGHPDTDTNMCVIFVFSKVAPSLISGHSYGVLNSS